MPDANRPAAGGRASAGDIAHGALRGVIAAMAMSGMRRVTTGLGLVDETPPKAILRQKTKGLLATVPKKKRRATIELFHWGYGAGGGAVFAALPSGVRRKPWAGPIYGFAVWVGFEAAIAPGFGLVQAKQARPVERAAFAVDHLLYGFVLSETRRRPQR